MSYTSFLQWNYYEHTTKEFSEKCWILPNGGHSIFHKIVAITQGFPGFPGDAKGLKKHDWK